MLLERLPIHIGNLRALPARLEAKDSELCVQSGTLTCEKMREYTVTVDEMHALGMNLQQVFFCWATPPHAGNLVFEGLTESALRAVHKALQHVVLRKRFAGLDWFGAGLSIKDLIRLHATPVDMLRTFNVTMYTLVDHNAHAYGENWNVFFNWSDEDWRKLGFEQRAYENYLQTLRQRAVANGAGAQVERVEGAYKRWGPKQTSMRTSVIQPLAHASAAQQRYMPSVF